MQSGRAAEKLLSRFLRGKEWNIQFENVFLA
jgi:hypothetical protein